MTVKTAFPPAISPRALVSAIPGWVWQVGIAFTIYLIVSHFILAAYPEAEPKLRFSLEPLMTASLIGHSGQAPNFGFVRVRIRVWVTLLFAV